MILKANGKYIDTLPIADLLSQEEILADTILFEVDRFYNGMDLAGFDFTIRGVTESGGETQCDLPKEVDEETVRLSWQVNEVFTTEAGVLQLDLFAYCYTDAEADRTSTPPDHILRYQLPPIQVRGLPESDSTLDSQSYTAFLLEVKATANDAIEIISGMVEEFEAKELDYTERISTLERGVETLRTTASNHGDALSAMSSSLNEQETQLEQLAEAQANMTPIEAMTQAEYDALESPAPRTLYVIQAEV